MTLIKSIRFIIALSFFGAVIGALVLIDHTLVKVYGGLHTVTDAAERLLKAIIKKAVEL